MKKKKITFIGLFALLLIIVSTMGVVGSNLSIDSRNYTAQLASELDIHAQTLTIALAKRLDPNYQIFNYGDGISQENKEKMDKAAEDYLASALDSSRNDVNLVVQAKNTVTLEEYDANTDRIHGDDDKNEYQYYVHMQYDSNGDNQAESSWKLDIKNATDVTMYSGIDYIFGDLINYAPEGNMAFNRFGNETIDYKEEYENGVSTITTDDITINPVKNLEVTYIVPHDILVNDFQGGVLIASINSKTYENDVIRVMIFAMIAIGLFMLAYPIKDVEEVHPFKLMKNWKFEINLIILFFALFYLVLFTCQATVYNINGMLAIRLQNFDIQDPHAAANAICTTFWFVTLFVGSICWFGIKYVINYGLIKYLKDHSIIYSGYKYIETNVINVDLSTEIKKPILIGSIINLFVILLLIKFGIELGGLIALMYCVFIYLYLTNRSKGLVDEYNDLINDTKQLSEGHFDVSIDSDKKIFKKLINEINNIQVGFEKAVQEETKSQNMKTELISNVSHDLKTPLTCIKNYLVLLQDDSLDSNTREEYMNNLDHYVNRLNNLIEDLFEVSKVNSGNISLNLMDLNVVALIEQAQVESQDSLKERNLDIISTYCNDEIILNLDGDKTYRVFENLFGNISKYAMPCSRVYIDVEDDESSWKITFKNMSEQPMNFTSEEITERFVRGDKSRHENGSGLGLAIAKSFIEVQGGKFSIDIDGDLFKVIISFQK